MTIALALKQFLAENRAVLVRELKELEENIGGNAFSLLLTGLDGLYLTAPERLPDSGDVEADVKFVLYNIFASLSGITVHFPQGTCLNRMLSLEGTLDKSLFQSFVTRFVRAGTAYAFRTAGSEDDLSVKVRDEGVLFLRERWKPLLQAKDVVSQYSVDVDCIGAKTTLGAIVVALDHTVTTAVAAFMATLATGEGWTPVVSEQAREAQVAYETLEALMATLSPEARELLVKHPKTLEVFVERQQKAGV